MEEDSWVLVIRKMWLMPSDSIQRSDGDRSKMAKGLT